VQLTKGPEAVPNLRPSALHPLAEAMIKSAGTTDNGQFFAGQLEATFEALGGLLPD
jgi:hypothetical protein